MKLNPKAIPGIHNYCDRWCERCDFTSRCNVFENTKDIPPEEQDIQNEAFWRQISDNFAEAHQMLFEMAKEHGIDLGAIPKEELDEIGRQQKKRRDQAENHPISKLTWTYSEQVMEWLENKSELKQKQDELIQNLELGIRTEKETEQQTARLKDCLEIIQWYVHFIHVKFMRALSGKFDDDDFGVDDDNPDSYGYQRDYDGSAKIALIAINRCIQAWSLILKFMPESEDHCLRMLALLQKVKSMAEKEFPNAWNFVRPGFDEVKSQ